MDAPSLRPHVALANAPIRKLFSLADGGLALFTQPTSDLELFDVTLQSVGSITGNGSAFEELVPTRTGFLAVGPHLPLHEGVIGGAFATTKLGKEECRRVVPTSLGFIAIGKKRVLVDVNGERAFVELSGHMELGGAAWRDGAVTAGKAGLAFLDAAGAIVKQTNDTLAHPPVPFGTGLACGDVLFDDQGSIVARLGPQPETPPTARKGWWAKASADRRDLVPFGSGLICRQADEPALLYREVQNHEDKVVWRFDGTTELGRPIVAGDRVVVPSVNGPISILDASGRELGKLELEGWLWDAVAFGDGVALHVSGTRDILWWRPDAAALVPLRHDVQPNAICATASGLASAERAALYVWSTDDPGPEHVPEPSPLPVGAPLVVEGELLTIQEPGRVLLRARRPDGTVVGVPRDATHRPALTREPASAIVNQLIRREFDDALPAIVTQPIPPDQRFAVQRQLSALPPSETVSLHGRALFAPTALSDDARALAGSTRSAFFTELGAALGLSARVVYASIRARQLPLLPPTQIPGYEYLGRFTTGEKAFACDPCYLRSTTLRIQLAVHVGTWHVFARNADSKYPGHTSELVVIHDDGFDLAARREVGSVGVDSGNAGVFDASCPKPNLDEQHPEGVFDGRAAFVSSGLGDGFYPVYVGDLNGRVAKVRIPFLGSEPGHDSSVQVVTSATSKRYAITERFKLGDAIEHSKYGIGAVVEVGVDDKIAVRFVDGTTRRLVHGKS